MNALQRLHDHGQSPWFDNIRRTLVASGELARMPVELQALAGQAQDRLSPLGVVVLALVDLHEPLHPTAREPLGQPVPVRERLLPRRLTARDGPDHDQAGHAVGVREREARRGVGAHRVPGEDDGTAAARVERFREHDQAILHQQYLIHDDESALIQSTTEARTELARLFEQDRTVVTEAAATEARLES